MYLVRPAKYHNTSPRRSRKSNFSSHLESCVADDRQRHLPPSRVSEIYQHEAQSSATVIPATAVWLEGRFPSTLR
jgi:hypothetical protein